MIVPETFFSVREELMLFGLSCAFGAIFGVFYDVFRTLRIMFRHSRFLVMLEDIIFLGCYAVFLPTFADTAARGVLRSYYFLGNLIGFVLYLLTVGTFVTGTLGKLFFAVNKALSIITKPVRTAYVRFHKKAAEKFVLCSENFTNRIKKLIYLLPKRHKMLYNKTENTERKNVKKVVGKQRKKEAHKKAEVQKT